MNDEIVFLEQQLRSAFTSKEFLAKAIASSPKNPTLLNKRYEAVNEVCTQLHQKLQEARMKQAQKTLYCMLLGVSPKDLEKKENPDLHDTAIEKVYELLQAESDRTGKPFKLCVESESYTYVVKIRPQTGEGEEHF